MKIGRTGYGLRYAVKKSGSAVAWAALSIRCGTRDEGSFRSGTAHFCEHTLFKGTLRRSASSINNRLDRLGGELNAFTTKEEIVIHATVLKEDLPKAVSLLLELATQATFPEKEVEREKGVVIEEINSYKDTPADDIYDRFEELLFAGHPLGRSILGTAASVRRITAEELRAFARGGFTPDRMALTVVAGLDEDRLEAQLRRLAEPFFAASAPAAPAPASPVASSLASAATPGSAATAPASGLIAPASGPAVAPGLVAPAGCLGAPGLAASASGPGLVAHALRGPYFAGHVFEKTVDKRNHELNAVFGATAPSLYEERERIATVLLANLLAGPGSNSVLNRELREKRGWVYGVEASYTQFRDSGVLAVSLGCDRDNFAACEKVILRQFALLRERPLTPAVLHAAKKQLIGQLSIGAEGGETQCLSMGKSLLAFGSISSDQEDRAKVEAVTADDLQAAARRILSPDSLSKLIFL